MTDMVYPPVSQALANARTKAAPEAHDAFRTFGKKVFADGALSAKTKQVIAVAVAHVTQCAYCISGHTKAALRVGATAEEIMEAIWVAAEMRAGAAYAHSLIALAAIEDEHSRREQSQPGAD
jgi:AhpD family alkylhydroperoxidase